LRLAKTCARARRNNVPNNSPNVQEEWEVGLLWRAGRELTYRYVSRAAAEAALEGLKRDGLRNVERLALRGYRVERTLIHEQFTVFPEEQP